MENKLPRKCNFIADLFTKPSQVLNHIIPKLNDIIDYCAELERDTRSHLATLHKCVAENRMASEPKLKEKENCGTCKFHSIGVGEAPCADCRGGYTNWQPKDKKKTCANCSEPATYVVCEMSLNPKPAAYYCKKHYEASREMDVTVTNNPNVPEEERTIRLPIGTADDGTLVFKDEETEPEPHHCCTPCRIAIENRIAIRCPFCDKETK